MEGVAYEQFLTLEREHWWFIGRRKNYLTVLGAHLERAGHTEQTKDLAILDVGCGVGGMLPELARFGRPVGLDSDAGSIDICKRRGFPDCRVAAGERLPVDDASQDLVTLFDCLEHVDDDAVALREVARVLKPGGFAFFSVPAYQFLFSNNDRVAHHKRRYVRGDLVRKVRAAGLDVAQSSYVNFLLFPLILPTLLLVKLRERLSPRADNARTNLTPKVPAPINALFAAIFGGEGKILRHLSMPFGHSLICVARKPAPR